MQMRTAFALILGTAASVAAQADVSIVSSSSTYSQNFDTLTTSTTAQTFANDSTLAGWSLFLANGSAPPSYAADTGSSTAGSFRSFGATGSSDRALGALASGGAYYGTPAVATGAPAGYIALALNNASGAALSSLILNYFGEQWRNGGNTTAQGLVLQYGLGATFGAVSSWTAAGTGFDFVSPVTGASAAAVDGNVAGLVTGLGGTISGLSWANGDTLWLRWQVLNNQGNDHGLAIDNLNLSVAAAPVPEPASGALLLAGLGAVGLLARRRSVRR